MDQSTKENMHSTQVLYQRFLEPVLAKDDGIDAEQLTQLALFALKEVSIHREWPIISQILNCLKNDLQRCDTRLEQQLFGCHFMNPIGLAAGFDKNGVAAAIWNNFGFGFAELGTVTWHPQEGNPKPRLFRLAAEKAALNRMGFNNNGAEAMLRTLEKQKLAKPGDRPTVIGLNFGKSKIISIEEASNDYAESMELLAPLADYAVINISSPNTPGLRKLQDSERLRQLITHLKSLESCPPLLIKIAPDLSNIEINQLAELIHEEKLAGIIAVNTSIDRLGLEQRVISQTGLTLEKETGGLSGFPLQERATEVIRQLHKKCKNLPLIGVGGVNSPKAAWERITAGASLVQVYTGWIYEGPGLTPLILEGILNQLDRHGFRNISEAVGTNVPWV
tara:strand:+ start:155 stop:1330 length:1176 start_codon:yes stop_codon:yes gene_type:complete